MPERESPPSEIQAYRQRSIAGLGCGGLLVVAALWSFAASGLPRDFSENPGYGFGELFAFCLIVYLGIWLMRGRETLQKYYDRSLTLMKEGKYDEALAILERIVTIHPKLVEYWYSLAACYARTGQMEKTSETLSHVKRLNRRCLRLVNGDSDFREFIVWSEKSEDNSGSGNP